MSDIVERLKRCGVSDCKEAAAEIERLRGDVRLLRKCLHSIAHGKLSGRDQANAVLAATAEEINP